MYKFVIVGGGIVGLSVARRLSQLDPSARIAVLEKEQTWAAHQTGRNSGVIHSGIYYKPGSLKARLARSGNRAMVSFCEQHGIQYDICGKLIVATHPSQLDQLQILYRRGLDHGLAVTLLSSAETKEIEPNLQCLQAIRVPSAGIVSYTQVCEALVSELKLAGTDLRLGAAVRAIHHQPHSIVADTASGSFEAEYLINCAGLHSDRVAKLEGAPAKAKIVPFRGEYYELKADRRHLVKNLIYPVPNPAFPFLGVHFTRMIDGSIHAGPNAVLSLKREGYSRLSFNWTDAFDTLSYPGFWKLAARYRKEGFEEIARSFRKDLFVRSLQALVPAVQPDDLVPAHPGVRAQALLPSGALVDDFMFERSHRALHVCNAPSPAATASLEIASYVVNQLHTSFGLENLAPSLQPTT